MGVTIKHKGDLKNTEKFFRDSKEIINIKNAKDFADVCLKNLIDNTPKDTGLTASSWAYKIIRTKDEVTIEFDNTNIQNGINIAILVDIGHASRNGSWIEGRNYIDPSIKNTYEEIVRNTWKELTDR